MSAKIQTEIEFPNTWGGKRKKAGRKRKAPRKQVPHRARSSLASRFPVHVTVRVTRRVRKLRGFRMASALRKVFARSCAREGFRICQFSVQGNHVHMICEAIDQQALGTGMRAFNARLAQAVNAAMRSRGQVVAERSHQEILKTPQQVRNALCYVLQNARRHGVAPSGWLGGIDPYSSGRYFDGWSEVPDLPEPGPDEPAVVADAHTWLLTTGWRRRGLIGVHEVPAAAQAR
jgi:REP element-mobilizing transposase RayT